MRVSFRWLSRYVQIDVSPEVLCRQLTAAGLSVETGRQIDGDTVFEIEITSNRPDWLSHIGIAREIAAVTGKQVSLPAEAGVAAGAGDDPVLDVQEPRLCPRYVARLIRDAAVGESPAEIQQLLRAVGSRPVNNAVDITNFCLFETGQPMHAFDFDRLRGGAIVVRRARDGETIVTIDGVVRTLDSTMLVIADAEKPVAIAGIMGGTETEVTAATKNILLESACFDAVAIRRTRRKLGLSTDASYRFERGVEPENVAAASRRAVALFAELMPQAREAACREFNQTVLPSRTIALNPARVSQLLGTQMPASTIKRILNSLGFIVQPQPGSRVVEVGVPCYRPDVRATEDLIEEVARVFGYERIEPALPPLKPRAAPAYPPRQQLRALLRRVLQAQGLQEVMSYAFQNRRATLLNKTAIEHAAQIRNPLSKELEFLRPGMIVSLLRIIAFNNNRAIKDCAVFEIGKQYSVKDGQPEEREMVAIMVCGRRPHHWLDRSRPVGFFDIKGVVETALRQVRVAGWEFVSAEDSRLRGGEALRICAGGSRLGTLGTVAPDLLTACDIAADVYYAEFDLAAMHAAEKTACWYAPLPKYPAVVRDIAIVVDRRVSAAQAQAVIRAAAGPLAVAAHLFDVYEGKPIAAGSKSLAFSIEYQSADTTLTDEQVSSVHQRVLSALSAQLQAVLR
ncbi:MAG: phenylalanine--tRNA ligase subunit beta [Candidatus Omnitrophica bacterium]|nr:phenylalanine--tRNA ligase subunit beta [Candidatus Omnitrophota bacterium]